MYNFEDFIVGDYGDKSIIPLSNFVRKQFSAKIPSYVYLPASINTVEDETSYVNVGQ